jgi:hypothetical protein
MAQQKLVLLKLPSIDVAQLCAGSSQVMGSEVFKLEAFGTVSDHIPDDILDMPVPHGVPCRLTALNTRPVVTDAAVIHLSTASFTQIGMGTVRTCLHLRTRSTIAQWPWRT